MDTKCDVYFDDDYEQSPSPDVQPDFNTSKLEDVSKCDRPSIDLSVITSSKAIDSNLNKNGNKFDEN